MPLLDMDPCLPSIDALEACMKENNFQSVKCTKILSDFKECCERFQDQSMLCRGYELVKRFTLPRIGK